ncbi:MAG: hypothetical protein H6618_10170, partial [Deltaproteobacteria bacterium]|nr:hypothetical protein [Deltaproteobacteria bacterium]
GEAKFRQIDRSLPVLISGISPLVRPASGTASAKLIFREDDMPEDLRQQLADRLHPGSIGMAEFRLNQREGIAVPRHAVSTERQKHLVLTVSDGKVLRKEVTIGKETEERIEITQGLSAGELVITRKNQYLRNGEKVRTDTDGSVHE